MSRTFVITGGAKGIGRCMVEYFASKGDKVYFIDNDAKTTIVVGNQLRGKGWDVHDFVGDIADKKTLIDFAAKVFLQSPNQKIPDRKTKCVIETHLNIKQNVIFGANLKPV